MCIRDRLWIGGSFPVNAKETGRGRVLFISSYSYAWETIPQQIDGIRKSLGDDVTIDYKFMDTKNVDTAENVHLFYKSLSYYLSQVPAYDVVIVGDDAAYNFVLVYRKIFGNTPIVFEGVNNVSKALAMDYNPNVTGIIENQTYGNTIAPVSYTHLDVYKRQVWAATHRQVHLPQMMMS